MTERYRVIDILLDYGIDAEASDNLGETALLGAVRRQNIKAVSTLLDHGARLDAVDHNGWSAMHFACGRKDMVMLALLIKR